MKIIICLAILTIVACSSVINISIAEGIKIGKNNITTRPVIIKVIDNETGLPVSNTTVFFKEGKERPYMLVETKMTINDFSKLKTDNNGEIAIPVRSYKLKPGEELTHMYFYFNLDVLNDNNLTNDDIINKFNRTMRNKKLTENVILVNSFYSATVVYLWNCDIIAFIDCNTEKTDFSNIFFRYDFNIPFSEEEEIKIIVKLARNTD